MDVRMEWELKKAEALAGVAIMTADEAHGSGQLGTEDAVRSMVNEIMLLKQATRSMWGVSGEAKDTAVGRVTGLAEGTAAWKIKERSGEAWFEFSGEQPFNATYGWGSREDAEEYLLHINAVGGERFTLSRASDEAWVSCDLEDRDDAFNIRDVLNAIPAEAA